MNIVGTLSPLRPQQDGRRLDQALAELLPDYSRSRIKEWILGGCVRLDGDAPEPRTRVAAGQQVELAATVEPDAGVAAQAVAFDIVYEDDDVLVVLKPAGLVVHPGAGNRDATLENGLRHHAPALAEPAAQRACCTGWTRTPVACCSWRRRSPAHTHLTRDAAGAAHHARVPGDRQRRR